MTEQAHSENGQGLTASQVAFQKQTDALAHHMIGVMIGGYPPVMVALAASQIVRAVIIDIARQNPQVAHDLLEDMAGAIVDLGHQLTAHIEAQAGTTQ